MSVVSSAFDRFVDDPLPTDPRPVPQPLDAPAGTWGELRELLLDPGLGTEAVDGIWRWLIERARSHGQDATLMCASLAVPMLARITDKFAAPHSTHRHDIESEILTALLTQLRGVELDQPRLWRQLRWAALHAGWLWVREHDVLVPVDEPRDWGEPGPMTPPHGHPELVLSDAVAEGVITADAAELIASTRWEQRSMTSVTDELGGSQSHWKFRKQRQRAESALVAWLAARIAAPDPAPASATDTPAVNTRPPGETPAAATADTRRPPSTTAGSTSGDSRSGPSSPAQHAPACELEEVRRCA
ncbi:hypothetical protein ACIBQ0_09395 [Nocardia nova]|uniref:hypothetical protein n=1 Tax=Nocardia nova TaxID=37330 RepID=UPI0037894FAC